MEKDNIKKGSPIIDSHKDFNYGSQGDGVSSEQIENSEIREDKFEKDRNINNSNDPSNTTIDPSIANKGNLSVQESNLSAEEKARFEKRAKDVEGGGDIGEGRGSGSDRA